MIKVTIRWFDTRTEYRLGGHSSQISITFLIKYPPPYMGHQILILSRNISGQDHCALCEDVKKVRARPGPGRINSSWSHNDPHKLWRNERGPWPWSATTWWHEHQSPDFPSNIQMGASFTEQLFRLTSCDEMNAWHWAHQSGGAWAAEII